MAIVPAVPVAAPEPRGLRTGLFTAANGPLDLPEHGRAGGVQYVPVSCGQARRYPVECPPEEDPPTPKTFDPGDEAITGDPFVVYATYVCGPVGYTQAELEAKVSRRLQNGEQAAVEEHLAILLNAEATPLMADDGGDIVSVVSELESWLYSTQLYGNVGYLHAPIGASAYLIAEHQIFQQGPIWRTPLGTIVTFGAYPEGELFITGQTTVWRSTDVLIPPAAQVLDRETNQYNLLAEREYAVAWDCHAASVAFTPAAS